jgi:peptidoglycan/LPS O-acetylase OafA/YrhL
MLFRATAALAFVGTVGIAALNYRFLGRPFLNLKDCLTGQARAAPVV